MSIIHRFTPPTCTLEIRDHNSSRWKKQQTIKNLGFKLSFDDPRISEEEQVTISGDREQLEQIYSLVLDYTENLLRKSFVPQLLTSSVTQELVNYELSLVNILDKNSPQKIQLSALQLFDLVSALEEYKSKIAVVAELETTPKKPILPLWTKILAALIVAAGLTNLVFQLTKAPRITESTISLQEEPEPEPEQQPLADTLEVIPPQVPKKEPSPTPQPKVTEPLSSANSLPPPPAIDLPKPAPDIPNPENFPFPEVGRR